MAANQRLNELAAAAAPAAGDLAIIGQGTNAFKVALSTLKTFMDGATVSQADAEVGTATVAERWTPQRVLQAVNAVGVTATGSTTARSLANWFADVENVIGHGAKGDGITDDTAAFQSAIDAAETAVATTPATGPAIVFAPAGQYLLGQVILKDRVIIVGAGISATEFKKKDNLNDHLFLSDNFATLTGQFKCLPSDGVINNIGFMHCRLEGNKGNNTSGDGVRLYAKNITFYQVVIQNFDGNGLFTELGVNCPVNDWSKLVEGNFDGLWIHSCDGHGWHARGPNDQFVNYMKIFLCGGDGIRMESSDGVYFASADFNHLHCYSNTGRGFHCINSSFRGAFIRLENSFKEGLLLDNADHCVFGAMHLFDNARTTGSAQGVIQSDSNFNVIGDLRVRLSGRTAAGGFQIIGNNNYVAGVISGEVNGGGNSTGIGLEVRDGAAFNTVNVEIHDFSGVGAVGLQTGSTTSINFNSITAVLQNNTTLWNNVIAGSHNNYKIIGSAISGATMFSGVGPPTLLTGLETWDVALRDASPAAVYSRRKVKHATTVNLDITTEQSFTIPHNLLVAPDLDDVQISLSYTGSNTTWNLQYMYVAAVSSTVVTVKVKLVTAAGSANTGNILMRVEL